MFSDSRCKNACKMLADLCPCFHRSPTKLCPDHVSFACWIVTEFWSFTHKSVPDLVICALNCARFCVICTLNCARILVVRALDCAQYFCTLPFSQPSWNTGHVIVKLRICCHFQANAVQYRLVVREVSSLQIINLYTCLDAIQCIEVSRSFLRFYLLVILFVCTKAVNKLLYQKTNTSRSLSKIVL